VCTLCKLCLAAVHGAQLTACVPSRAGWVDKAWHELILDTRAYDKHCSHLMRIAAGANADRPAGDSGAATAAAGSDGGALVGCDCRGFIHHNPDGAEDADRHARYAATLAAYAARYGEAPPPLAWESAEEAERFAALRAARGVEAPC
jgi:hypothetical protein